MDKFISKNENNLKEKKYLDQSIKERNKVIEDFMNDMDKKIEKENYEEEEEDDFDKIENEYMRKKNEESKRKNKEEIKLIKEQNGNYEKYIVNGTCDGAITSNNKYDNFFITTIIKCNN